jgi:hypothetical protein
MLYRRTELNEADNRNKRGPCAEQTEPPADMTMAPVGKPAKQTREVKSCQSWQEE